MTGMSGDHTISITTGTIVKTLVVLGGAWLLYYLRDLVLVIVTAVVLASAIEPGVQSLKHYKVPRVLAVIGIYVIVVGIFFSIFLFFIPLVVQDLATLLSEIPLYLERVNTLSALDEYSSIFGVPMPVVSAESLVGELKTALDATGIFTDAFTAMSQVFGGVLSFILIFVFTFYFAVSETGVGDFLRFVTPRQYEGYVIDLWRRSQTKIGLWMQGQVLLGLLIGAFVYLGLTIIGVKYALLLAVLAALLELIPVFGPTLAAVPAVILGLANGGVGVAIAVVLLYVILQQFENHLLYPLVVTKVVGVPPLLVILALIIGAKLAGFLGILLSAPMAAVIQELVKDVESRKGFASN
jgi:predicted PurR-regulated permease PerM